MKKRVVYIAGPMRGIPAYNFPAFHDAERRAKRQGFITINPARLDEEAGFDPYTATEADVERVKVEFIKRDLEQLQKATAIALLPNWQASRGAVAEFCVARWLGLEVLNASDFQPYRGIETLTVAL